jgi:carbonic anhydrase
MSNFERIIKNNKQWSKKKMAEDKDYFKRHADSQSPKYCWIGCADSRIPAETILGLEPG